MSLSGNIICLFCDQNNDSDRVICAARDYCKHHEHDVQKNGRGHCCRICKMIFHGFVCSDGDVQDQNNMCCLLCWDIAKANQTVTDLVTLQQLHDREYRLFLENAVAIDPDELLQPKTLTNSNPEANADDGSSCSLFGLCFLKQREVPSKYYQDYEECKHPDEQGKIVCIWDGTLKPGYPFDIESGWMIPHPCSSKTKEGKESLGDKLTPEERPPEGMRLKHNPYGCYLQMDKHKCCTRCIVKSIHAQLH